MARPAKAQEMEDEFHDAVRLVDHFSALERPVNPKVMRWTAMAPARGNSTLSATAKVAAKHRHVDVSHVRFLGGFWEMCVRW